MTYKQNMSLRVLSILTIIILNVSTFYGQDRLSWVTGADLRYTKPISRSEEGMPVGNGRMGSLVWTIPSALKFQVNRVDIFGNNTASNSFFERNTDYCGGAGFVDINFVDFGEDVFTDGQFDQHLSCHDGLVSTNGKNIKTETLVWNEKDVMAIRVEDQRPDPSAISACLRMLRSPLVIAISSCFNAESVTFSLLSNVAALAT